MVALTIILFLLVLNAWTALQFWLDKKRARGGSWRIPEADLLGLALFGGSAGALLASRIFRHKTRKEPFATTLMVIAVVQAGALAGYSLG